MNGNPAITLDLFRQPAADMIDTVDRVRAMLPLLQASVPPAMRLNVTEDRTMMIRASVRDVEITLVVSVILVILVVFAFLRSPLGHGHSQRSGAFVVGGHRWGDVPAGLFVSITFR